MARALASSWRRGMTTIGLHQATNRPIQLSTDDRRQHLYVIGASGVGKSTLLESMALDDIHAGNGVAFIDPHGQSAERIADCIPVERTQDVLYVEYDPAHPIGFNVLDADPSPLTVEHIVSAFRNIWRASWGANLEDVLRCSLYLLIDTPGSTLMDIPRLLTDKPFRTRLLESCTNEVVARFWLDEFEDKSDKQKAEEIRSTANKVRQFLSKPYLASIIGAKYSTLDWLTA
jgi:energy-coupling factor transporter ATP-binding protein EcfA2